MGKAEKPERTDLLQNRIRPYPYAFMLNALLEVG